MVSAAPTPTVAVTGASGFVGSHIVRFLLSRGWHVVPLSRSGRNGTIALDLCQPTELDTHLVGVDVLIHCAAEAHQAPQAGESPADFRKRIFRLNRDAIAPLAEACRGAGVGRFLFLSSAKVYGEQSVAPFAEDDPLQPVDPYGTSKMAAEEILNTFAPHLEACSLRLPLIYGPSPKANLARLLRLAGSGAPLPFASIRNRRSLLGLNNLNRVIAAMLEADRWPHRVLNVADPEPISTSDLIRALAHSCGKRARLLPFPPRLLGGLLASLGRGEDFVRLAGDLELSTARLAHWLPHLRLESTPDALVQMLAPAAEHAA
ncbi:NAD-dependent epimerase/dehydratase family protein [Gilvimarinus sp. F26214L]|uniref:NAD-dependent epimerase/dehydratase family protein n=1 Tax=Gilvimarinus sp. DZF01 TaxID=3461371 RepID=UPI004045C5A1